MKNSNSYLSDFSKLDREYWRTLFEKDQSPTDMRYNVEQLRKRLSPKLLYKTGLQFWIEANVASDFATLLKAETVRLVKAHRPDFEIEIAGQHYLYEITEADRSERRRGDEYREIDQRFANGETTIIEDAGDRIWLTPQVVHEDLERASLKKATKEYDPTRNQFDGLGNR